MTWVGATAALGDLVAACTALLGEDDPAGACAAEVRATLATHRRQIAARYDDLRDAEAIHRSDGLTVLVVATPPRFWSWPHEHGMWGVTAMVAGAEDDVVYDRKGHGIIERRRFRIDEGIAATFGPDVVHAAGNASDHVTLGLQLFGGDPVVAENLEWDPSTGQSRRVDADTVARRRAAMAG